MDGISINRVAGVLEMEKYCEILCNYFLFLFSIFRQLLVCFLCEVFDKNFKDLATFLHINLFNPIHVIPQLPGSNYQVTCDCNTSIHISIIIKLDAWFVLYM